jgi:hypothetical protein
MSFFPPAPEWLIAVNYGEETWRFLNRWVGWKRCPRGGSGELLYFDRQIRQLGEEPNRFRDEKGVIDLAKAVQTIHESGLYHRDFHAGNFLWHQRHFLTDLHDARLLRSSLRKQL